LSDGQFYVGEFKEGEHSGRGIITYYDKSQETGEWKDGKFIVSQKIKAPKKPEAGEDDRLFGRDQFLPIDTGETGELNSLQPDDFFAEEKKEILFQPENFFAEEKHENSFQPENFFIEEQQESPFPEHSFAESQNEPRQ
jgi:hypothetical protein